MKKMRFLPALALSAGIAAFAVQVRADIGGAVKLDGEAGEQPQIDMSADRNCAEKHADPVLDPTVTVGENGALANVIVYVKADDPTALGGEAPTDPVELDQEGCMYKPHVLSMTVGQDLMVKNSDEFLHNVHSLATINPAFNFGQPNKDPGKKVDPPKAAEIFRIKCDVHPWMSAYVGVFEHPFHAVSGEDGKFTIKGSLPDGEHTLVAWHEKFGEQEQQVTVKDGKAEGDVAFSFKPEAAMGDEPVVGTVTVAAMTESKGKDKASCGSCCESAKSVARNGEKKAEEAPKQAEAKTDGDDKAEKAAESEKKGDQQASAGN